MPKARTAADARRLEDIPNIGRAMAQDLRAMGIERPAQLAGRDPFALYRRLCRLTGTRQDPCVEDTFVAAVRFMEGGPPLPWWHYSARRKRRAGGHR